MLKKLALAIGVLSVATSQLVTAASAETVVTNKVEVKVFYDAVDLCLDSPERLSFRLKFTGEVKTFNADAPKKIRVAYQVVDKTDKLTIGSRALNLKKSKGYVNKSRRIVAQAGHRLSYRLKASYHAFGGTHRFYDRSSDKIPSAEEMVGLPYC